MVWIKEAESLGREEAADRLAIKVQEAADRLALEQEGAVTEEKVADFIAKFEQPILPIVEDLTNAGYVVVKKDPGYIHHSYNDEEDSRDDALRIHTLVRDKDSYGWGMTDYTRGTTQAFGERWDIMEKDTNSENVLGSLMIFPIKNSRTNLAGVLYRGKFGGIYGRLFNLSLVSYSDGQQTPEEIENVTLRIQETISGWIKSSSRSKIVAEAT